MELKGQKVIHIMPGGKPGKYGTGTIVDTQNKDVLERIDVKFDTEEKVKSFSFPECFGRYLMLENFELAKQIEDIQKVYSAAREKLQQQGKTSSKAQKPVEAANSILDELDSMIGLDEVKRDVHMLTAFIRVNNLRRARGLKAPVISKHLVLIGNPGTGKTTVARMIARMIARIYHSIGAIKKNKIVETSRAGLVAGYVGQTAIKTQEVINSALGGVLFIDEAYSLINGAKDDFGMEALATLLSAMENHRDDLVVIVAGYEDRMRQFINANPGLSSRFRRYLHFEDYNSDDLISIFTALCEENEYSLQEDAEKRMSEYLQEVCECRSEDFGNARSVRNMFERIIAHQAERIVELNEVEDETLIELTLSDVENAIQTAA